MTVGYGYANDLIGQISGTGSANADFSISFSIHDQHGHFVTASPVELNKSVTAPANGPEIITSGTGSVSLNLVGLTAGDVYTISISGHAFASANSPIVPEPTSLGAIACGAMLVLRRRR